MYFQVNIDIGGLWRRKRSGQKLSRAVQLLFNMKMIKVDWANPARSHHIGGSEVTITQWIIIECPHMMFRVPRYCQGTEGLGQDHLGHSSARERD